MTYVDACQTYALSVVFKVEMLKHIGEGDLPEVLAYYQIYFRVLRGVTPRFVISITDDRFNAY